MKTNPTERFTDRVANYVLYRPDYPSEIIDYLQQKTGLSKTSAVADIGSGTGIFTRHLLDTDCKVYAIEPNEAMRQAAEEMLFEYPNLISLNGTATNTTLEEQSIDLIVCAQAFHWFNNAATKQEFHRILKPGGMAALIWNNRIVDADDFSKDYDQLLKSLSNDYNEVNHQQLTDKDFLAFYQDGDYEFVTFPNEQVFDEEGLIGRAQSSSYVPAGDTPEGQLFVTALKALFHKYQQDHCVRFIYQTEVYTGRV